MAQRLRGDEVQILVTAGGNLEEAFDNISNFNIELEIETKSVGFLGQKSELKDDQYKGCKFDFEIQLSSQQIFLFAKKVLDRAKRITPDLEINITGVFSYSNGDTVVGTIKDARFGPIPINTPARNDYVKVKVSGEASDVEFTTS